MKKLVNVLKITVVILVIMLISLVAFWGVYSENKGIWSDLVPEYKLGMDIDGARELRYVLEDSEEDVEEESDEESDDETEEESDEKYVYVDANGEVISEVWKDGTAITEEDETSDESEEETESEDSEETETDAEASEETEEAEETYTNTEYEETLYHKETRVVKANDKDLSKDSIEETKKIIIERLKKQDIESYDIRIDELTGALTIDTVSDDDNLSAIESMVEQAGKFQIVDYQNGIQLMDNSYIKNASVVYSTDSEYKVYLQIEFNKEGSEKLKEISNKYIEVKNEEESEETSEEESEETDDDSDEEESTIYKVSILLDGSKMTTTYFGEEMSRGILQLTVGDSTTDTDEFKENYESAQKIADILNTGVLPITYELKTDNFVKSSITNKTKTIAMIVFFAIIAILSIILIIKYKAKGILGAIISIGFVAVLSIVARYTNVIITINSLLTYMIVILMNYVLVNSILKNYDKENGFNESIMKFYLNTIPVSVLVVVFIFTKNTVINSIGMAAFWGMIWIVLYNEIFSRAVLKK